MYVFTLHEKGVASSHEVKNGWRDSHDTFLVLGRIQTAIHSHYHLARWPDNRWCVNRVSIPHHTTGFGGNTQISVTVGVKARRYLSDVALLRDWRVWGASGAMLRGFYPPQSSPETAQAGKRAENERPLFLFVSLFPFSFSVYLHLACLYFVPLWQ